MTPTLHLIRDLDYGGAATQLRRLAAEQRSRGGVVTVVSLRRPGPVADELRAAGVVVQWLGGRAWLDPFACARLGAIAAGAEPRTVQTWDPPSGRHWWFARHTTNRVAVWLHAVRDAAPVDAVERRVRAAADRLIATCEALVAAGERTRVVPNAVGHEELPAADRDRALRCAGAPPDAKLIVAATRLDSARMAKELVWAADLVRVVRPEVRLVLVGDGPARRRVERFARGATEAGLVWFARGRGDYPELLAASDVVWCASESPGAPTPLVEAMRAGRPVVANEAPGREGLLVDGETGWLTPWNDRAGWARATVRALEDEGEAASVGAAARRRVREALAPEAAWGAYEQAVGG